MPNSGYYTGQHSQFPVNTRTYLGSMNASLDGSGFFPTTQAERSAMWYRDDNRSPVGITCIEFFFYFSSFEPGDHTENRFFMEGKSRQGNNNSPTDIIKIFYRGANGANPAKDIRVILRQTNSLNASSNNNISVKFDSTNNMDTILAVNRWYHFVLRWSNSSSRWQAYIGSMGLNADGTDGGTASVLNAFAGSNPNEGSYMGFSSSQITSTTKGPIGLFNCNQTDDYSNLKTAFNINGRAASKTLENHGIYGGMAEVRFWKSTLSTVRSLAEIETEKTLAVIHETHNNLAHCLRFNENPPANQSLLLGNYADVGQYEMGLIGNDNGFFNNNPNYSTITINPNSYPYDITSQHEPTGIANEWEVAGTCAGESVYLDFYGQHWANDLDGNPIYREQPDLPLSGEGGPPGIENYTGGENIRAIVRDYIRPDLLYYLPGTGVIEEDSVSNGVHTQSLVLPRFNILSGHAAVFQNVYLFDNNILLNTGATEYEYFANADLGPYAFTEQDTGTISLNLFAE